MLEHLRWTLVNGVAACAVAAFGCAPASAEAQADDASASSTPETDKEDAGGETREDAGVPGEDASAHDASSDAGGTLGPSAGCGKAGASTGLAARSMTVAGKSRKYILVVPPAYDASVPLPLVVAFHGTGPENGTAAKARADYGLEAKAAGKAVFLYPEALPSTIPAYLGQQRWDPNKGSDDYAFFDALVDEVEASHCIDRNRVSATGFSNGGRMTFMLGCYRGDVLRAIAPVASGGNEGVAPISGCTGEVAVWGGLGNDDAAHESGQALVLDYYPKANGCTAKRAPTTPAGCEAYAGCKTELPVVWCTYPGGHTWPSLGAGGVWGFFDRLE